MSIFVIRLRRTDHKVIVLGWVHSQNSARRNLGEFQEACIGRYEFISQTYNPQVHTEGLHLREEWTA